MSCGEYVCKNSDCGHVEFANRMVSECPKCGADTAAFFDTTVSATECPALGVFLEGQGFPGAWDGILRNARTEEQRRAQFHCWMDAFRTMKLFHHLRDCAHPDTALEAGLPALLDWCGVRKTAGDPIALLERLRANWG